MRIHLSNCSPFRLEITGPKDILEISTLVWKTVDILAGQGVDKFRLEIDYQSYWLSKEDYPLKIIDIFSRELQKHFSKRLLTSLPI